MMVKITLSYSYGEPPDGHEIWFETYRGLDVPPNFKDMEILFGTTGSGGYSATFELMFCTWDIEANCLDIHLSEHTNFKDEKEFWEHVDMFLTDERFLVCDGNTAGKTMDAIAARKQD